MSSSSRRSSLTAVLIGIVLGGLGITAKAVAVVRPMNISLPVAFTENRGQWREQVLYRADAGGAVLWFAPEGVAMQLLGLPPTSSATPFNQNHDESRVAASNRIGSDGLITLQFLGASSGTELSAAGPLDYKCNYFHGNDASQWITNVPNFSEVTYHGLYPGIDLRYFAVGSQVEYEFVLEPGADIGTIRLRYNGAESLSIGEDGKLLIETLFGQVRETAPVIYQWDGVLRHVIAGGFTLLDERTFGFRTTEPIRSDLTLVIDPTLEFSSFIEDCGAYDLALDAADNLYVTGYAKSSLPLLNPVDSVFEGTVECFVTKIDASGSGLVYSTYLGGTEIFPPSVPEFGRAIVVDTSGAAVVTGFTNAPDFPTANAIFPSFSGGESPDVFITKLTPDGDSLVFSTYFGGSSRDEGWRLDLDSNMNIYLAGSTASTNLPVVRAYDTQPGSIFFLKMPPDGDSLIYCSYFLRKDDNYVLYPCIAAAPDGRVILSGSTREATVTNFPLVDPFDSLYSNLTNSDVDGFVTVFAPDGDSIIFSTLFGGDYYDAIEDVGLDGNGDIVVCGSTNTPETGNFPLLNAWDPVFDGTAGSSGDGFVAKISGDTHDLIFSTYIGGAQSDVAEKLDVSDDGSIFIVGRQIRFDYGLAADWPVVNADSYDGSCPTSGGSTVVVSKFTSSGSADYSLYLEGTSREEGWGVAADGSGDAVFAGWTTSCDFPVRRSFDGTINSANSYAGVVFKLVDGDIDCACSRNGDVRGDCAIDALDMSDLIDHLFNGGAQPPIDGPLCPHIDRGDYNCDGQDDALDLAYLIDHIFAGGPCPCDPCGCISYPDNCPGW